MSAEIYSDSEAFQQKLRTNVRASREELFAYLRMMFGELALRNIDGEDERQFDQILRFLYNRAANDVEQFYVNENVRASEQASANMMNAALKVLLLDKSVS